MTPRRAAGARAHERDRLLRAPARRVRARRGRAPVGRRGQRVPRLPVRHLGHEPRSLPPARGRGRARAGRAADARRATSSTPSPRCAWPSACRARASAARCSSATPAPRPTRPRSSSRARPAPGGDVVVVHGAFHGRTYGALSATPQESKQAPFAPLVPGFRAVAARAARRCARAVDERTAAVLLEPIQGESGVHVLSEELLARRARGLRRARRGAHLRRGPVRHGPHRHALGLRADRRACPTRSRSPRRSAAGLPIGALVTGERLADVLAARRPRLDLRRRPGDRRAPRSPRSR